MDWSRPAAAAGGLLAGGSVGYLIGAEIDSGTVEAAGTWVGGLGTIAAVIYAARAFTAETRHRERELAAEAKRTADEVERTTRERARQAAFVRYELRGGGGFGLDPDFTMESLWVIAENASHEPATRVRVFAADRIVWESASLIPGEKFEKLVNLPKGHGLRFTQSEASQRPITSFTTAMEYEHGDLRWRRVGPADPNEVVSD